MLSSGWTSCNEPSTSDMHIAPLRLGPANSVDQSGSSMTSDLPPGLTILAGRAHGLIGPCPCGPSTVPAACSDSLVGQNGIHCRKGGQVGAAKPLDGVAPLCGASRLGELSRPRSASLRNPIVFPTAFVAKKDPDLCFSVLSTRAGITTASWPCFWSRVIRTSFLWFSLDVLTTLRHIWTTHLIAKRQENKARKTFKTRKMHVSAN